tara:strand:- start:4928 stop:6385 length:1458 start_codon:yes stop_codon:yes gene_type:complete
MKVKNKEVTIKYLTFLLFFILNYFLFVFQKDYSIITKDLQTLFVTSEVIQKTWVPYLEVWDHKGPLYFWIYAFLDLLIFDKVMLINLYIIIFNSFFCNIIFWHNFKYNSNWVFSLLPSLFYAFVSNTFLFGKSIYYEQFIILLLILAYKTQKNISSLATGLLLGLSSLIANTAVLFIPIFIFLYPKLKDLIKLATGFSIITLGSYAYFYLNKLGSIYLYTNYLYPFEYSANHLGVPRDNVGILSIFYLLKNDLSNLYFFSFVILCVVFLVTFFSSFFYNKISKHNLLDLLFPAIGLLIPIIAGKYFGHHFLYFIIFFLYSFSTFYNSKLFNSFFSKIFIVLILSFNFFFFGSLFIDTLKYENHKFNIFRNYEYEVISSQILNDYPKLKTIFILRNIYLADSTNLTPVNYISHTPLYIEDYQLVEKINQIRGTNESLDTIIESSPDLLVCKLYPKEFYEKYCNNTDYFSYKIFNNSEIFINNKFRK